ncbi:RNA polymerase sigma factor [Stutzerimonas kirkiae]|uniref:RNA polymerase sigma factor n=1 Tax=Stutzerimonas kirkiae TaxID=2211392 RepID=UPI001F62593C|nr:sigma-70 family RNA polymerase sigma factor [Stutzerimonas kirkiae]
MSNMTTEELEQAFKAHARELRVFLYRRLKSMETAADLSQETYLRLLRQPPREPVENLRALIFRIGRNLAIDHVRIRDSRERHDQGLAYLYEVTGESPQLIDLIAADEDLRVLSEAVQRMGEPGRSIFMKCRLQGMAYKDVARELGVSLSTVEKHLAGALDFLRRCLQR